MNTTGRCACQIHWLNRITKGRGKAESLQICIDSCSVMFSPVSRPGDYAACKTACSDVKNNIDR